MCFTRCRHYISYLFSHFEFLLVCAHAHVEGTKTAASTFVVIYMQVSTATILFSLYVQTLAIIVFRRLYIIIIIIIIII